MRNGGSRHASDSPERAATSACGSGNPWEPGAPNCGVDDSRLSSSSMAKASVVSLPPS
jgi:hypothetical protein